MTAHSTVLGVQYVIADMQQALPLTHRQHYAELHSIDESVTL
jgi:hypothetical protein